MKIGIIVFARMSSQRFPEKALASVNGRPLIGVVLDRLYNLSKKHQLVLATSSQSSDDVLVEFASGENVTCFRGSLDNVFDRAISCAEHFNFDAIVRVCGDRPFVSTKIIEAQIECLQASKCDLVTNLVPRTAPPGLSSEVITLNAMQTASKFNLTAEHKEHFTSVFYENLSNFHVVNSFNELRYPAGVSYAIDEVEDLEKIKAAFLRVGRDHKYCETQSLVDAFNMRLN